MDRHGPRVPASEGGSARKNRAGRGGLRAARRDAGTPISGLLSRVLGSLYDEALRPSGLRASQLALLWAIAAAEPVDLGRLGHVTLTDQTTLSVERRLVGKRE